MRQVEGNQSPAGVGRAHHAARVPCRVVSCSPLGTASPPPRIFARGGEALRLPQQESRHRHRPEGRVRVRHRRRGRRARGPFPALVPGSAMPLSATRGGTPLRWRTPTVGRPGIPRRRQAEGPRNDQGNDKLPCAAAACFGHPCASAHQAAPRRTAARDGAGGRCRPCRGLGRCGHFGSVGGMRATSGRGVRQQRRSRTAGEVAEGGPRPLGWPALPFPAPPCRGRAGQATWTSAPFGVSVAT